MQLNYKDDSLLNLVGASLEDTRFKVLEARDKEEKYSDQWNKLTNLAFRIEELREEVDAI